MATKIAGIPEIIYHQIRIEFYRKRQTPDFRVVRLEALHYEDWGNLLASLMNPFIPFLGLTQGGGGTE